MQKRSSTQVFLRDGTPGTIEAWQPDTGDGAHALVSVEGVARVWLSVGDLQPQADGSYVLPVDRAHLMDVGSTVIPVMAEELRVEKRVVETGTVRLRKVVHEREEVIAPEVTREFVQVERVAVGRVVDGPVAPRQEGDTLVVSVYEEVVVVEKRLMLIEELRVTVQRETRTATPQRVALRREEVVVERDDAPAREHR